MDDNDDIDELNNLNSSEITEISEDDDEPQFDLSPEEATNLDGSGSLKPTIFNRKKLLIYMAVGLSVIVLFAAIINSVKSNKNQSTDDDEYSQHISSQREFLNSLLNRSSTNNAQRARTEESENTVIEELPTPLPEVSLSRSPPQPPPAPTQPSGNQPPSPPSGGSGNYQDHFRSSLVPQVQGSLFNQSSQAYQAQLPNQNNSMPQTQGFTPTPVQYNNNSVSNYNAQNNQDNKNDFFNSFSDGDMLSSGQYIGRNSVWIGTIISGILLTAINTDLPGHVLARVTNNVYDSQTGTVLLIPQGSVLIARYNSSISYAQSRVQIVWNTLIRPDGIQIDLGGSPGVDTEGMSGQSAKYSENWFEYAKAAGIITLFSMANGKMAETAARFGGENNGNTAANSVLAANSQVVNQLGGNIVDRALNIQPTLTVENGTVINILLNKTLFLPPVNNFPVTQRYIRR